MALNNLLYVTVAVFISLLPVVVRAEQEEAPNLLKEMLLEAGKVSQVTYYYCPRTTQCSIRCAAGEGHISISYSNVRRLEIASAEKELLIGMHYADPVGKSHVASAFLPLPASCVFDDLVLSAIAPVEDGTVIKPPDDRDVIFDIEPNR